MKTVIVTLQAKEEYMIQDVLYELNYHDYVKDGSVKTKVVIGDDNNENN